MNSIRNAAPTIFSRYDAFGLHKKPRKSNIFTGKYVLNLSGNSFWITPTQYIYVMLHLGKAKYHRKRKSIETLFSDD